MPSTATLFLPNANTGAPPRPREHTGIPTPPIAREARDPYPRNRGKSSHRRDRFHPAFRGDTTRPLHSAKALVDDANTALVAPDVLAAYCFRPSTAAYPLSPVARLRPIEPGMRTCRFRDATRRRSPSP